MFACFCWFFLSYKGRISRQEFWLGNAATIVVEIMVVHLLQDASLGGSGAFYSTSAMSLARYEFTLGLAKVIATGILLWPRGALLLKRLHDLGLSAWWLLVVPATIILAMATGLPALNTLVAVILLMVLGCLPGSRGDNRFGADPLAATRSRAR